MSGGKIKVYGTMTFMMGEQARMMDWPK